MKGFLSVKAVLVVVILVVGALSAGTALAGRQAGVSPQLALTEKAGANIVLSSICAAPVSRKLPAPVTVWGSGWASKEVILISLIKNEDTAFMWFSGSVNEAGAFEIAFEVLPAGKYPGGEERPQIPGLGIYTLEAVGSTGRLATHPLIFVAEKCPAGVTSYGVGEAREPTGY